MLPHFEWGLQMNMRLSRIAGWVVSVALLPGFALGDKITLKDGTVLEGTAIKSAEGYWFKSADGNRRQIAAADVESVVKGSGGPAMPAAPGAPAASGSMSIATTKARADRATAPVAAVAIWQEFIDSKPGPDDLKIAKGELEKWQGMQADGSEKIHGRWVGGSERKQILAQAGKLHIEALKLIRQNQTLPAIKKLEEAQQIYPNSFPSAFWLGYLSMLKHDNPAATSYLNQALRLRPGSPETMANLALIQLDKRDPRLLGEGIISLHKAAQSGDCREIAQDLITALAVLPDVQKKSGKMKSVVDDANLLASKYEIHGPLANFLLVPLREHEGAGGDDGSDGKQTPPGSYYSGTGFLISADGLILTNRHVVKGAKTMLVQIGGSEQKSGKIIKIDEEQDLALVQVTVDHPLPFLQLSASPAHLGAECTVMGFPLIDRFGQNLKITRGIVTGTQPLDIGADVMVDAKVNPGNSGGPILDKYGNVLGIVSMKSLATASEDSFGLGISAAQIKKFLEKNKIEIHNGAVGPAALSTEDIVTKTQPATVCILSTH